MQKDSNMQKCRACGREFEVRVDGVLNPSYPFCSDRCRFSDLNSWLETDYKIPVKERDYELEE
jgi:endogenous inhibitor of DNA gyrase (YacG/DUF329 family)